MREWQQQIFPGGDFSRSPDVADVCGISFFTCAEAARIRSPDMNARSAALRGFLTGLGFWVVLVLVSYFLPLSNVLLVPTLPLYASIPLGLVLLPGSAFVGSVAGTAKVRRFLKIFSAALLVYTACALAAAVILILGDPSPYPPDNALWRKLGGSMALGLTGALIFALPVLPVLAVVCFFLERKTRPRVQ